MNSPFDQSDRSLYSFLVDAYVGYFLNSKISEKDLVPRTFASEPNGGVLTESWLILIKTFQDSSNIEELRTNAKLLEKSEKLTESIAGHTLLWALANYEYNRSRGKAKIVIDDVLDDLLDDLLKD